MEKIKAAQAQLVKREAPTTETLPNRNSTVMNGNGPRLSTGKKKRVARLSLNGDESEFVEILVDDIKAPAIKLDD